MHADQINSSDIRQAVACLRAGGLVAFPTETVYGLGADARNLAAIERLYAVKKRPTHHPLIVHLGRPQEISEWAVNIPDIAYQLIEAFWPGPLTLLLTKHPEVLPAVTGAQESIGLRMPAHPVALALLTRFGSGIAAPSANKFTHVSPTTASAVVEEFGDQIDFILEGGACSVGLESTIIDLSGHSQHATPTILRPGMISAEEIAAVLGQTISVVNAGKQTLRVPGSHRLHYAPLTPAHLIDTQDLATQIPHMELPAGLILHSKLDISLPVSLECIHLPADAPGYAQQLYQQLRRLDHYHLRHIYIEAVPDTPEWEAIHDRLLKATASRG